MIDAVHFVPQSRPRLFIVAARADIAIPSALCDTGPGELFHPRTLQIAFGKIPADLKAGWIWWKLPEPPIRNTFVSDFLEDDPSDVPWHTPAETRKLLGMMSGINLEKVRLAKREGRRIAGTVYKRTRRDGAGRKVQRAEVRFDGVAGCLRTPAGGSSRQLVLVVDGRKIRSRLISSRETARLMGLPDDYSLPEKYNEAYHLTGDGVVVPVVRFLEASLIHPVITQAIEPRKAA